MFFIAFMQYFLQGRINKTLALFCFVAGVSYGSIMAFLLYPYFVFHRGFGPYFQLQIFAHLIMILISFSFIKFFTDLNKKDFIFVSLLYITKAVIDLSFKTNPYIYREYSLELSDYKYPVYFFLLLFQLLLISISRVHLTKKTD